MTESAAPQFNDGASYERMMGKWSQLAGAVFLDWLAPRAGMTWIDIGCGNGAFTEMIADRCAPATLDGIDPSDAQLAFARSRPGLATARLQRGDAMALPFADDTFEAAAMALVIFFVPEPVRGVAEMVRVVRPGGLVAAYAWDLTRGGFPIYAVGEELQALGSTPLRAPRAEVSRMENLKALWREAGLEAIETREIVVERTFANFEHFWSIVLDSNAAAPILALDVDRRQLLRERVAARLPCDHAGRITYTARANAIKGRRPR